MKFYFKEEALVIDLNRIESMEMVKIEDKSFVPPIDGITTGSGVNQYLDEYVLITLYSGSQYQIRSYSIQELVKLLKEA